MATSVDELRIIRPFLPSLSHLSSVRVAASLTKEFNFRTLKGAYEEIQHKNSTSSTERSEGNQMTHSRATKNWLFIPAHLRIEVWEACTGLHFSNYLWLKDHSDVDVNKYFLYFRSDGTVNRIKTAQYLVLNKNINIKIRFDVACNYCLEKSIQVLWSEMEVSGDVESFETAEFSMARFWINRMCYWSEVPWTQGVLDYIESLESPPLREIRFSSFFPLLQPKERQRVFNYLPYMNFDDLQFLLYALTKEEEEKVMKTVAYSVLFFHLNWPLRDLFLETAARMWKFIDAETFCKFIERFTSCPGMKEHLFYFKVFADFWERSPNHLKEIVNECPVLKKNVDSFLNEV